MRVVAFDIDGLLDSEEGLEEYRRLKDEDDVVVGIVTARRKRASMRFIEKNDLDPAFVETGFPKIQSLRSIEEEYPDGEFVYYGSWARDRLATVIVGWEYKTPTRG